MAMERRRNVLSMAQRFIVFGDERMTNISEVTELTPLTSTPDDISEVWSFGIKVRGQQTRYVEFRDRSVVEAVRKGLSEFMTDREVPLNVLHYKVLWNNSVTACQAFGRTRRPVVSDTKGCYRLDLRKLDKFGWEKFDQLLKLLLGLRMSQSSPDDRFLLQEHKEEWSFHSCPLFAYVRFDEQWCLSLDDSPGRYEESNFERSVIPIVHGIAEEHMAARRTNDENASTRCFKLEMDTQSENDVERGLDIMLNRLAKLGMVRHEEDEDPTRPIKILYVAFDDRWSYSLKVTHAAHVHGAFHSVTPQRMDELIRFWERTGAPTRRDKQPSNN